MTDLRVLTYNVHSLRDDVDALTSVVKACAPDVVAVQEAPRFLRWRSKRAALARECGLLVATADRPGGLFVMTTLRVQVLATSFSLLPKTPRRHQRAVAVATVGVDGTNWRVACTHLGLDADERHRHLVPLWSALVAPAGAGAGAPLVLAGDINESPGGAAFDELASRLQDCFATAGTGPGGTSPAGTPMKRIDAIFADRSLSVVSCETVDLPGVAQASDHRPVLAVLRQ